MQIHDVKPTIENQMKNATAKYARLKSQGTTQLDDLKQINIQMTKRTKIGGSTFPLRAPNTSLKKA
jgi:hypothetical protein